MDTAEAGPSDQTPAPDIRLTYCYICNAQIYSERPHDWDSKCINARGKTLNWAPVTCSSTECLQKYSVLSRTQIPHLSAAYIGTITYDGGPFLEFAARLGRDEVLAEPDPATSSVIKQAFLYGNAHRLEDLFQAWFFFGLLRELLGTTYCEDDFLEDNGRRITTRRLQGILEPWTNEIVDVNEASLDRVKYLKACLAFTKKAVDRVVSTRRDPSSFDLDLLKTISLTWEMVNTAFREKYSEESNDVSSSDIGLRITLLSRLTEGGWCPYEARNALEDSRTLCRALLYSEMERRRCRGQHTECTASECCLLRSEPGRITVPLHLEDGCSCKEVGLSDSQMEKVIEILYRQQIPVIQFPKASEEFENLEIVEASANNPYVAISHVWRHGLGNSLANRINECQLFRLQQYTRSLSSISNAEGASNPLGLWLDTLLCPITPDNARIAAIMLLRKTYTQASHVLVLDDELQHLSTSATSVIEIAARLSLTQWTRRLWTLQEGCLPYELWFNMEDSMINAHSLWLAILDICRQPDPICADLSVEARRFYNSIRISDRYYSNLVGPHLRLDIVGTALAPRAVTKSSDESICIPTLLGLDMQQILEAPEQDRMKILWKLIGQENLLGKRILFYQGSKLAEPGYRWAPSTFLQDGSRFGFKGFQDELGIASITPRGLHLQSQGILFQIPGSPQGLNAEKWDLPATSGLSKFCHDDRISSKADIPSMVSLRDLDGRWVYLWAVDTASWASNGNCLSEDPNAVWKQLGFSGGDYGILQRIPGPLFQQGVDSLALVVRVEEINDQVYCAPIVLVRALPAFSTHFFDQATTMADEIRKSLNKQTPPEEVNEVLLNAIESSMLQADQVNAASQGTEGFKHALKYAVAGRYATVKRRLPENQSWVVS